MDAPAPEHDTIDAASEAIEKLVLDDLALLGWDSVSCARVLMNLRDRLDRMADKLLDNVEIVRDIMGDIK